MACAAATDLSAVSRVNEVFISEYDLSLALTLKRYSAQPTLEIKVMVRTVISFRSDEDTPCISDGIQEFEKFKQFSEHRRWPPVPLPQQKFELSSRILTSLGL